MAEEKKLKKYWADLNSFEVEAHDAEEAKEIAWQMIQDDVSLACPVEVVPADYDDED